MTSDSPPAKPPANAMPDNSQQHTTLWSLLAAVVLLGILAGPLAAGRIYMKDDLGHYHLPVRAFYAQQLAQGEPFDWMPHLYCGFYLTGEGQVGAYHPMHLAIYRFLPFRAAMGCELLFSYPIMLAGWFVLLRRRLGRSDAAMFGSLVFTFCGFNLLHFIHPNAVAILAHVPWLLWCIDIALCSHGRVRVAAALAGVALLTGSQLLLGYPQYVWFSLLAEAVYALALMVHRTSDDYCAGSDAPGWRAALEGVWSSRSRWLRLVAAKFCGLLLGAIQLLPTADALAHSSRQTVDAAFAYEGSLHPINLARLVAPYLYADRLLNLSVHEAGIYAGAVPLMLIGWLWIRREQLGPLRRPVRALVWLGLFALLMALGRYFPLYSLQTYLPLVGHFRSPSRYFVLFHLATSAVAAVGFVLLMRENRQRRETSVIASPGSDRSRWGVLWNEFKPLWVLAGLSIVAAGVGLIWRGRPEFSTPSGALLGPLLLIPAALLVALTARGSRLALVGLVLLTAADLGYYGMSYAAYSQTGVLEDFPVEAAIPPGKPRQRVMANHPSLATKQNRVGNRMTMAGWRRADGYAGLEPLQRLDYGGLPALRVAGVRWVKRLEPYATTEGLLSDDERWFEVPSPQPRVRLIGHVQQSDDPRRDIARIDIDSTALIEEPLDVSDTRPGRATIIKDRPGRLHIRCDCDSPQLLVVSERYHPGWRATVDGEARRVLRVNGDFLGCRVGPGQPDVILEFRPDSLYWGRIVTAIGAGLLLLLFAVCVYFPTPHEVKSR